MLNYLEIVDAGGYDQSETKEALYALTSRLCALCEEIENKKNGRMYSIPPWAPVRMPRRIDRNGFNEEDTDQLITELRSTLAELEKKLIR